MNLGGWFGSDLISVAADIQFCVWRLGINVSRTSRRKFISGKAGTNVGPQLYNDVKGRAASTLLAQLRTGHCGLSYYLWRSKWWTVRIAKCADMRKRPQSISSSAKLLERKTRVKKEYSCGKDEDCDSVRRQRGYSSSLSLRVLESFLTEFSLPIL